MSSAKSLLLVFLSFVLLLVSCSKQAVEELPSRPVRAVEVAQSQQQLMAEYAGHIQARVESPLGFRVAGKILTRKVDVGSTVKAGQVLMQLDPQDLQLALAQAKANARAAQTNFDMSALELKRFQELRKIDAVSQSALEAKTVAYDAAKASNEQAQANLKEQENQTRYGNLVSDVDGVVTAVLAEVGQVVAVGVPVVKIAKLNATDGGNKNLSDLEVAIAIPENNVDIVTKADAIQIQLWANRKETLKGSIREISPAADPATRTFAAKIRLVDLTPKQIALAKLGMTASVKFLLTTPQAYVRLPLSALLQSKGQSQVWLVEKNRVQQKPVQVVGVNGNDVLVTGLNPGQFVVTAGVHVLNPNQLVTILPPDEPAQEVASPLSAQALMAPLNSTGSEGKR